MSASLRTTSRIVTRTFCNNGVQKAILFRRTSRPGGGGCVTVTNNRKNAAQAAPGSPRRQRVLAYPVEALTTVPHHHHHRLVTTPSSITPCCRLFSTVASRSSSATSGTATTDDDDDDDDDDDAMIGDEERRSPINTNDGLSLTPPILSSSRRVWKCVQDEDEDALVDSNLLSSPLTTTEDRGDHGVVVSSWTKAVDDADRDSLDDILTRIGEQEREGGRMRQSQLGVLREDPAEDMRLLIENYTVPALASALRDREDVLQLCAYLLAEGDVVQLQDTLRPFERQYVQMRRRRENNLDLTSGGFTTPTLEMLRKGLMRMPRSVSQAHHRRAGVVLPLCNVDGVPCILFEKRSARLRAHPDEVCLPGGMVSTPFDNTIVQTCLREMKEEIDGIDIDMVTVLGVLRCNWGEVHHLTGVAVTPVVCFIGEIGKADLKPNPDEVAECFTVPLSRFLDRRRWIHREDFAPIFTGGPHIIWGLTGYIVERFVKDIMASYSVSLPQSS